MSPRETLVGAYAIPPVHQPGRAAHIIRAARGFYVTARCGYQFVAVGLLCIEPGRRIPTCRACREATP